MGSLAVSGKDNTAVVGSDPDYHILVLSAGKPLAIRSIAMFEDKLENWKEKKNVACA